MWKDNLVFYKSKSYLISLHKYSRSTKRLSSFTNKSLWPEISLAIPGQIILVKQVNIHVYSNEVRYLSLMLIVNSLHARVYWPFQGGASFVDPFCYLCFM